MKFNSMSESENLLKGHWQNVTFLNYAVNDELLKPYLPKGCEIDYFEGKAYVSVIAQQVSQAYFLGLSLGIFKEFPQITLRFYTLQEGQRSFRIIHEFLPSSLAALGARILYHEPCHSGVMESRFSTTPQHVRAMYTLEDNSQQMQIRIKAQNKPSVCEATSPEFFFHFRAKGVSQDFLSETFSYNVYHSPWKALPIESIDVSHNLSHFFGENFNFLDNREPDSSYLFDGSDFALSGTRYPIRELEVADRDISRSQSSDLALD